MDYVGINSIIAIVIAFGMAILGKRPIVCSQGQQIDRKRLMEALKIQSIWWSVSKLHYIFLDDGQLARDIHHTANEFRTIDIVSI